ncbi:type IV pilus assembly protein PilM [Jatrophihabitans fulvus]
MAAPLTAGLDIGATHVRAVEVRRTRTRTMVERFEQVPLPAGAVVGGVVKDGKAVVAALKQLRGRKMLGGKGLALAVTHQQVVVRELEVPRLPADQLRQALPHLAREAMPLAVDEAVLDFIPLEDADAKSGKDTVRGLLAAAPREAVTHAVDAVEKAGLHVAKVDLACFALLRAVAGCRDGAEAVIDLGADTTMFVMHHRGVPQLVRTIPRGGDDLTSLMCRRLGLRVPEAEELKRSHGLLPHPDPDVTDAIGDGVRPLISEIRSSLGYWHGSRTEPVERVSIVGGAARLPGFADELGRALGVPTVVGNPLQYVGYARRSRGSDELSAQRSAVAVSVGLTLGAAA